MNCPVSLRIGQLLEQRLQAGDASGGDVLLRQRFDLVQRFLYTLRRCYARTAHCLDPIHKDLLLRGIDLLLVDFVFRNLAPFRIVHVRFTHFYRKMSGERATLLECSSQNRADFGGSSSLEGGRSSRRFSRRSCYFGVAFRWRGFGKWTAFRGKEGFQGA